MKIGIIGTGRIGKAFAKGWHKHGHEIMLGSREPNATANLASEIGAGVRVGSQRDSAEFGEVVVLAFPWYAFTDVEREIGDLLDGKVVVDCINPFKSSGSLALGHKWSAGEEIAKTFHRAKVVKAFNHLYYSVLENADFGEVSADAFMCSNYDKAKEVVAELARELGFNPVDAGPIKNSRLIEPLAALWTQLAFLTHHGPDTAFKLIHRP